MAERHPGHEDPPPTPPEPEPEPEPTPEPSPPVPAEDAPAPLDLTEYPQPGEHEAEFLARTRAVPPASTGPSDIVPNRPNIVMGPGA
jgi:hypothetical protein